MSTLASRLRAVADKIGRTYSASTMARINEQMATEAAMALPELRAIASALEEQAEEMRAQSAKFPYPVTRRTADKWADALADRRKG